MTYIVAISAYLVLLTIFGLIVARKKVKTSDDMVTGGHRIPFIILVGTLLATWCGGGGITGSASVVYTGGPWVGLITFAAPPIGIILLYFIAGKVRKSNKVTVPEIMGARYGKAASIIAALCVMLAYVGVLATQLKAAADIIVLLCASSGIEISHGLALTICTALIAIITVGGGLVSVAYSDAISALLMIGGFFLAIPFLIGVANSQGATLPPEKMTITGGMSGWELLGYFLPSLALMLGDQNMLQRFASAKNSDEAKKSNIGMFIGEILVIISIVLVVTQAAKLYPTLDVPSNVIFQVAVDYLPLAFGALVMCACMAFIVTTADSYLLSSATNLTNDIYVKYIRKDATDKQKMLVLRGTIIVFSFIAVALTLYFPHCAVPADDGLHHVRRRHHPGDPVRPLLQEGDARRRHGRYPGGRSGHDHLDADGHALRHPVRHCGGACLGDCHTDRQRRDPLQRSQAVSGSPVPGQLIPGGAEEMLFCPVFSVR